MCSVQLLKYFLHENDSFKINAICLERMGYSAGLDEAHKVTSFLPLQQRTPAQAGFNSVPSPLPLPFPIANGLNHNMPCRRAMSVTRLTLTATNKMANLHHLGEQAAAMSILHKHTLSAKPRETRVTFYNHMRRLAKE